MQVDKLPKGPAFDVPLGTYLLEDEERCPSIGTCAFCPERLQVPPCRVPDFLPNT